MKDNGSINNPDVTNTDPAYWEKILKGHNLDMKRGRRTSDVYAESRYCDDLIQRDEELAAQLQEARARTTVGFSVVDENLDDRESE